MERKRGSWSLSDLHIDVHGFNEDRINSEIDSLIAHPEQGVKAASQASHYLQIVAHESCHFIHSLFARALNEVSYWRRQTLDIEFMIFTGIGMNGAKFSTGFEDVPGALAAQVHKIPDSEFVEFITGKIERLSQKNEVARRFYQNSFSDSSGRPISAASLVEGAAFAFQELTIRTGRVIEYSPQDLEQYERAFRFYLEEIGGSSDLMRSKAQFFSLVNCILYYGTNDPQMSVYEGLEVTNLFREACRYLSKSSKFQNLERDADIPQVMALVHNVVVELCEKRCELQGLSFIEKPMVFQDRRTRTVCKFLEKKFPGIKSPDYLHKVICDKELLSDFLSCIGNNEIADLKIEALNGQQLYFSEDASLFKLMHDVRSFLASGRAFCCAKCEELTGARAFSYCQSRDGLSERVRFFGDEVTIPDLIES